MSIFLEDNSIIPINEVYFGKTSKLQQAENVLGRFRSNYYKHKYLNNNAMDPLLEKYDNLMADVFGFYAFSLIIQPSLLENAYTYSQVYSFTEKKANLKSTKEGFKFDGTVSCVVNIYSSLIFDDAYTDAEMMAIILHEIGHNFSQKRSLLINLDWGISWLYLVLDIIEGKFFNSQWNAINLFNASEIGRRITKRTLELRKQNKSLDTVITTTKFFLNLPKDLITIALLPIVPILNIVQLPYIIEDGLISLIFSPIDFSSQIINERIADNFATLYGYGPDLATGLEKMNIRIGSLKWIHNDYIPIIGWLYDLLYIPVQFILSPFDTHPTISSRRRDQYNYLINELKKSGHSKKTIKEIEDNIKSMEKSIEETQIRVKELKGTAVYDKYIVLTNKLVKGDDIRSYFSKSTEKNSQIWDDMYEKYTQEHTISSIKNINLI